MGRNFYIFFTVMCICITGGMYIDKQRAISVERFKQSEISVEKYDVIEQIAYKSKKDNNKAVLLMLDDALKDSKITNREYKGIIDGSEYVEKQQLKAQKIKSIKITVDGKADRLKASNDQIASAALAIN